MTSIYTYREGGATKRWLEQVRGKKMTMVEFLAGAVLSNRISGERLKTVFGVLLVFMAETILLESSFEILQS